MPVFSSYSQRGTHTIFLGREGKLIDALQEVLSLLPPRLAGAVRAFSCAHRISEVRLRGGLPLSLTVGVRNVFLNESGRACSFQNALIVSAEEVDQTIFSLCKGSVYRHAKTLSSGFLVTEYGVRAGLCMRSVLKEGHRHLSLRDFSGVNLRIPYAVCGAAEEVFHFFQTHTPASVLVYSLPGAGKTTLLRDLALGLSSGRGMPPLRVVAVDERGELFPRGGALTHGAGLLDVLSGVKKAEGIERATRLLTPEWIVCDELGEEADCRALLSASCRGVCLAASVHAASVEEIRSSARLSGLWDAGLFCVFCGITCDASGKRRVHVTERTL